MPRPTKELQREYQNRWMKQRRSEVFAGKTCEYCGSDAQEIHHQDKTTKESHRIWSWTKSRQEEELRKCVFICRDCHTKLHADEMKGQRAHGTYAAYKKYKCQCGVCKPAYLDHRKEQYKRRVARVQLNGTALKAEGGNTHGGANPSPSSNGT